MKRTPTDLWAPLSSSELDALRKLALGDVVIDGTNWQTLVAEATAFQSVVQKGLAVKPGRAQRSAKPFLTPEGLAVLLDIEGVMTAGPDEACPGVPTS